MFFSNVSAPVKKNPTRNTARIQAAVRAIQEARRMHIEKICILTDSEFLVEAITEMMPKWKEQDWKKVSGAAINNLNDFILLDYLIGKNRYNRIKFMHIGDASDDPSLKLADRLAKQGAQMYGNNNNDK